MTLATPPPMPERPAPVSTATPGPGPDWFHGPAAGGDHWRWLDGAPVQGLEVTEHAVPAGWFARTFGTRRQQG